jgi:hypothetical protein
MFITEGMRWLTALPHPPHGHRCSACGIYASAMLVLTCYIGGCPLGGSDELTANLKS